MESFSHVERVALGLGGDGGELKAVVETYEVLNEEDDTDVVAWRVCMAWPLPGCRGPRVTLCGACVSYPGR